MTGEAWNWILFAAILAFVLVMMLKGGGKRVCATCGHLGAPKSPGSILIEIFLWLCFLFPGLIYSLWRAMSRKRCAECGGNDLIKPDSPRGKELMARYHKPVGYEPNP